MADSAKDILKKVKQLQSNYLRYNFGDVSTNSQSDVYAYVKGRMYDDWIDLTGRTNSYSSGDLIQNPVGIIESVIRDMYAAEYDLVVSSFTTVSVIFNGSTHSLRESKNDYYNNAYLHNIDQGWTKKINDYVGSQKRILVTSTETTEIGDRCFITNIGSDLVDYTTFDTEMTSRETWSFGLSLDTQIETYTLLDQLCFESQTMLFKNNDKYKIKKIGTGTLSGTLSNPLTERNGNKMVDVTLSSIEDVFTDFIVNYGFIPNQNVYARSIYCNKDGSNSAYMTSTYQTLCKNAETNYKVSKKLEINLDFIFDEPTAAYFTQRLVKEKTKQRLIVGYVGNIKDHIQYEKGDLVKLNIPDRIPSSINNSTQFLIAKQDIPFKRGSTEVIFKLVEMIE